MNIKVINKAKTKVKDNIKITKETDQKIYFEVNSFQGSYNKNMKTQAPQWFKDFEKKNDARWDNQQKFNSKQEQFNSKQEQFNSKQEQFNKNLEKRIDNIVSKNNLTE